MKKCSFIFITILLSGFFFPKFTYAQGKESQKLEKQAFQHVRAGEWYFALPLFVKLSSIYPEDPEYAFAAGQCYFNTDNKAEGLSYFKKAALFGHKSELMDFYLARAYHFNLLFDSAVYYYNKYLPHAKENDEDFLASDPTPAEIRNYIANCHTGKKLVANPVELRIENIGTAINTKFPEYVPVVSSDETLLMFTTRRGTTSSKATNAEGRHFEDIFYSKKDEQGIWQLPQNIGGPINTKFDDACIGLSHDGSKLLVYNGTNGGDIYVSENKNHTWSKPKPMEGEINTASWEGSASFTIDENILYFSSDRPGGIGGSDLYFAKKLPNGEWGKVENLGPSINTPYDEDAPQIHVDGKTLFFSSKGHKGMGGFDIFSATLKIEDSTWTQPRNIGYPINTADDDIYFSLTADGSKGYFTSYRVDGNGEQDIYIMHRPLSSPAHVLLKGRVLDDVNKPLAAIITLTRQKDQVIEKMTKSNPETGNYSFEMEFDKDYNLTVEAEGFFYFTENINIGKQPDIFEYVMNFTSDKNNVYVVEVFDGSESAAKNSPISLSSIQSQELQIADAKNLRIAETKKTDFKQPEDNNKVNPEVAKSLDTKKVIATTSTKPEPVTSTQFKARISRTNEESIVQNRTLTPLGVGKKMVLNNIYFEFDKADLKFESTNELNNLLSLLNKNPSLQVELSGHTDNTGRKKYNQKLSEKRAKAVFNFLQQNGIEPGRLVVVGYGDSKPMVSNLTPEGRSINRRTEIEIIDIEKTNKALIASSEIEGSNTPELQVYKSGIKSENPLPIKAHFLHNNGEFLTDYTKIRLNSILELVKKESYLHFIIVGYEDHETEDSSKKLSKERAQTVYNYLVKHGIPEGRIEIKDSEVFTPEILASQKGISRRKVEFYVRER